MANWTEADIPGQHGRTAVVTGASSGLGLATTVALARHGARVVMAVRNTGAGERVATSIRAAVPGAALEVRALDLASLASVAAFAVGVVADYPALDLLINNAGLVLLGPRRETSDGFELHIGTNFLGHFALTGLLLGVLSSAPAARVVSLSSITHKPVELDFSDLMSTRGYNARVVYGKSKLATTVFGIELDGRLRAAGSAVKSVIAHPGVSRSNLTARAFADQGQLARLMSNLEILFNQSTERGALPQLYAATAEGVQGGQFFGPSGFREVRGQVTQVRASAQAMDPSVGARLWQASEKLTGITYLSSKSARD